MAKYFTLSYDDGVEQDKKLIEIFRRYNLKCTFNLNSGYFGNIHDLTRADKQIHHNEIPADEIRQVYDGFEVATHSVTHPDLTKLSREEIIVQVDEDRKSLSALVGYAVIGHAYPGGGFDRRVADCLRDDCSIQYARTVCAHNTFTLPEDFLIWHPTCHHNEPEIFRLLDAFLAADGSEKDLLFYLWGHAYEFDYGTDFNNWEHIERICERIAGKDDIIYCTNGGFVFK